MTNGYEVIIAGLGGAGSSAAYRLARRGVSVLGLDCAGRANDFGSSHGGSRIVRMAYAEGADFIPLLLRAHALWDELGEAAGQPVLRRCGVLFIGRPGSAVVADTLACARAFGFPHEVLDAAGLRQRSPAISVADDMRACFDPRAGVVSPEQAVALNLRLATQHGATLRFNEAITEWSAAGDAVHVRTACGTYHGRRLVLCAGAWSPSLLPAGPPPIRVQRQVQHWFDVPAEQVAALDPARFPVHVWDDGHLFYCMPMVDGPGGGIKCCLELDPPPIDPDALERAVAPAEAAAVRDLLACYVPAASGSWLRGSACMYAATPDNRFLIGPLPGSPQIVLAAGLGGHGFKFTPAIGELVADLVTGAIDAGSDRLAPFDPARFAHALAS